MILVITCDIPFFDLLSGFLEGGCLIRSIKVSDSTCNSFLKNVFYVFILCIFGRFEYTTGVSLALVSVNAVNI